MNSRPAAAMGLMGMDNLRSHTMEIFCGYWLHYQRILLYTILTYVVLTELGCSMFMVD